MSKSAASVPVRLPAAGFYAWKAAENKIFGRTDTSDPLLSRKHFRIFFRQDAWFIQDLNSTNGTFQNGTALDGRTARLENGDLLQAGNLQLLFWDGLLFSSEPLPLKAAVLSRETDAGAVMLEPFDFEASPVVWPLELPSISLPPAKPHWFSMVGSSLMIGISALASVGAMALTSPDNPQMMISSAVTSLSMAGAFLGYGLIQNRLQNGQAQRETEEKTALYQNYLSRQQQLVHSALRERTRKMDVQKAALSSFHPGLKGMFSQTDWILPLGLQKESWIVFDHPSLRYDQSETREARLLADFKNAALKADAWSVLKAGESARLPSLKKGEKEKLFALWAWLNWNPNRFWIWVDDEPADVLFHQACSFHGQKLVFSSLQQALDLAVSWPDQEWVIFVSKPCALPASLPAHTAILDASGSHPGVGSSSVLNGLLSKTDCLPLLRSQMQSSAGFSFQEAWSFLHRKADGADVFRQSFANLKVHLSEDVIWDLKEDGPHALIAGTTGSGKSEGMTCMLLQLALNNSSQYLQYMLIDFKGGAFGQIFYEFDHLAGSVTNLEQDSFERFEKALNLELERRQKKMAGFARQYPLLDQNIDVFNSCHPEDPISHLFVIVDEFAELKRQQPQAMGYLQQTARIGRSLGVHLILATQKPGGVVDEQIWSNTQSRLCFKVASPMESREVLGHDKAAFLKGPGEFILQHTSEKPDQSARAWYSRARVCPGPSFQITNSRTGEVHDFSEGFTALDKISRLIQASAQKRKWILHPFSEDGKGPAPVLADGIDHLKPLHPSDACGWWILAPKEVQEKICASLAAFSEVPAVTFNFACPGLPLIHPDDLWQIHQTSRELLLLVRMEESMDPGLISLLHANPKLRLVIFSEDFKPAWHAAASSMDRFASSVTDRQKLFEFFLENIPPVSYPAFAAQTAGIRQSGRFCMPARGFEKPTAPFEVITQPIALCDLSTAGLSFVLGFDLFGQPVYWSRRRPLLLAWSTKAGEELARKLASLMVFQDPLLSCGPPGSAAGIQLASLREASSASALAALDLDDFSIVWCGSQLGQYAWQLKLSSVMQSLPAVFIEQGICMEFKPVETKEE